MKHIIVTAIALLMLSDSLPAAEKQQMTALTTPEGIRFSIIGAQPIGPLPTLLVLAADKETTLSEDEFNECGKLLLKRGSLLCVSLDAPAHGEDHRAGEPDNRLQAWRIRSEQRENIILPFIHRARAVLDYLIAMHYSDPDHIAIAGTSRGGYLALQLAAVDRRISAVVLFSPVTDVSYLAEFRGASKETLQNATGDHVLTKSFAGRPVWLCIGNMDQRVSTDLSIDFFRGVIQDSVENNRPAPSELHIMQAEGHHTPHDAPDLAAKWLAKYIWK